MGGGRWNDLPLTVLPSIGMVNANDYRNCINNNMRIFGKILD